MIDQIYKLILLFVFKKYIIYKLLNENTITEILFNLLINLIL